MENLLLSTKAVGLIRNGGKFQFSLVLGINTRETLKRLSADILQAPGYRLRPNRLVKEVLMTLFNFYLIPGFYLYNICLNYLF